MKWMAILAAIGLLGFSQAGRADYVDETEDLVPPVSGSESDAEAVWNSVAEDGEGQEAGYEREQPSVNLRYGDALSEVQDSDD